MQRDARAYLWDIRQCADAITKFTTGMGFAAYAQDELVRAAVERNRIPDVRDVIAFRNVLIHGYAAVDHARVWRAIQESLPDLRSAAVMLLDELGPPQSL